MTDNKENTQIPKNSPWITGAIFAVLLILTFFIGWVAGPMISQWQQKSAEAPHTSGEDDHQHGAPAEAADTAEDQWYVCPMHPWVVQQGEGTCPICTMDLTPLDPERFSGEISIDPVIVQNIGVRVEQIGLSTISNSFESVGIIEADERRVADVIARVKGWIEKVYVNETGVMVHNGARLVDIYSPELESAQRELLILLDNDYAPDSRLVTAARNRLVNLNMNQSEIQRLMDERDVVRTVGLFAPRSGFITEKFIESGQEIRPGQVAYRITDLSRLWVIATVYEHQLPDVEEGQTVNVSQQYDHRRTVTGRVDYIYPTVDKTSRQVEVRIEIPNPDMLFKPGMYVSVDFLADEEETDTVLTAPREAIIYSGERNLAFVSKGQGVFEPRTVVTGRDADDGYVEVLSGLQAGEHVVTSGQFLLDSESRIRESLLKMVRGDMATEQKPALDIRATTHVQDFQFDATASLESFLFDFSQMHEKLFSGSFSQQLPELADLQTSFDTLLKKQEWPSGTRVHIDEANAAMHRLNSAASLEEARVAFAFLGNAVNEMLLITGLPEELQEDYMGVQCGMFPDTPNQGIWLQSVGSARNPFYGQGCPMETCNTDMWAYPVSGEATPAEAVGTEAALTVDSDVADEGRTTDMGEVLNSYFSLHEALYRNDPGGAALAAERLGNDLIDGHPLSVSAAEHLKALQATADLEAARKAFGNLSQIFHSYFNENGVPAEFAGELVTKHCGMYPGVPQDGIWIQKKGKTRNPFFGEDHMMAACAPEEWSLPAEK